MKNRYEVQGDVTVIFVKRKGIEYECLIDTSDFDLVAGYKGTWHVHSDSKGYLCVRASHGGPRLHRFILGCEGLVDHIDRNTFNNRRLNLRPATSGDNVWNRGVQRNNKVGIRGVHQHKKDGKWVAQVKYKGSVVLYKHYDNILDATMAVVAARNQCKPPTILRVPIRGLVS